MKQTTLRISKRKNRLLVSRAVVAEAPPPRPPTPPPPVEPPLQYGFIDSKALNRMFHKSTTIRPYVVT